MVGGWCVLFGGLTNNEFDQLYRADDCSAGEDAEEEIEDRRS